jgi:hypothetical protein
VGEQRGQGGWERGGKGASVLGCKGATSDPLTAISLRQEAIKYRPDRSGISRRLIRRSRIRDLEVCQSS